MLGSRMLTKVLAALGVSACALAMASRADASWGFELGIGEQGLGMFSWLGAAERAGARPLVAFASSWRRWGLPSYRTYLRCTRDFHERYPWVRDFNPWNEANHGSQPTYREPRRAAGLYNALRRVCRGCNVAAGNVLDWWNMRRWLLEYKRHLRGHPRLWSSWMLSLPSNSRRIRRVYSYQWQAECDPHTWDSAWFRPDGAARRSYRTVVAAIARERHLDAAATRALNPPVGPGVTDTCVG